MLFMKLYMLQKKGQCKNEVLKSCFFRKKSYEVGLFHFFFGVCVCNRYSYLSVSSHSLNSFLRLLEPSLKKADRTLEMKMAFFFQCSDHVLFDCKTDQSC